MVASVAVHYALIPGALIFAASDACGDFGRLRSDERLDPVDGVPELLGDVAGDLSIIDACAACTFPRENDNVVLYERFAGDAAVFVVFQTGVQNSVAYLVGVFVGVVFAYLFGAEKSHFSSISLFLIVTRYFSGMYGTAAANISASSASVNFWNLTPPPEKSSTFFTEMTIVGFCVLLLV